MRCDPQDGRRYPYDHDDRKTDSPTESLVLAGDLFESEHESFGSTTIQVRECQLPVLNRRPFVGELADPEVVEHERESPLQCLGPSLCVLTFSFLSSHAFIVQRTEQLIDSFDESIISPFGRRSVRHFRSLEPRACATSASPGP